MLNDLTTINTSSSSKNLYQFLLFNTIVTNYNYCCIEMLDCDRDDITEGINISKINNTYKCKICQLQLRITTITITMCI